MSHSKSKEDFSYESVQEERKTSTRPLPPSVVSKAVSWEAKFGQYKLGEELFDYLNEVLEYKRGNKNDYYYSELDIIAVQRSISSLVRYAPNVEKARCYFNYVLRELEEPLRSLSFELTLMNNLLFVYTSSTTNDNQMKEALELLKVALEIGIFQVVIPASYSQQNTRFNNPLEVFETLSKKVLRYFKMEFNEDKTAVRPAQKLFSH